jgi:putative nucleotidyltransferase with HDIG domain
MDALLTATVRRGKDHAILGYQGIVRDVTDLKHNERELKRTLETLKRSIGAITLTLSMVVESRDPYTAGHQKRVANLSRAIAQEMDLSPSLCDAVLMAGTLHDIGKIAIPSEILSSPAKLSDKAYELIKDHPQTGYDILREIEFPWPVANIVLQHHEKMDGSGYPKGLSGNDIMLEARIIAVADVVESMASHRPYRPSRGLESALEEIVHNSGTFYDPDVVAACVRLLREKGYQLERT